MHRRSAAQTRPLPRRRPTQLALLAAGLALAAGAAAAPGGLTPRDVARLRQVTELAVSPDGSRVAYVLQVPRALVEEEDGRAWAELHVVDRDGRSRPYVSGSVRVEQVAWTPTGEISFLSARGEEETSLYLIPVAGGEARRAISRATALEGYTVSPDGRRVAFLAAEEEPAGRRTLRQHGLLPEVYEEDLRPVRLWVAPLDGSAAPQALPLEGSAREVRWSPAGDRLALKVSPTPLTDDGYVATRLRFLDPDSGEVTARVDNPGKLGEMAWSPDGRFLAVITAADPHDPSAGRLAVVDADGGPLRDLLPGLEGHVVGLAWSGPDRIVYVAQEGLAARLGEVARDGSGDRDLAAAGGPIWDAVRVGATTVAARGSTPEHPDEVFLLAQGGGRRLTDSNPWLAERRLAPQEAVRYQARDGLPLEGVLIRPLDGAPGGPDPLIVVVHGGPEAHVSNGWVTGYASPGQTAAACGFAVFYPNYRGSTGRGVAFSKLSQGDPAGREFEDILDGVDHLVAAGVADRARVGITGASYGGYATAWGATHDSARFAAAVMFVGISDKVSKFGSSDIPRELHLVHDRSWPWEEAELWRRRSPLTYVEQARTPILILHGEEDRRVHPSQSLMLYRSLHLLGQTPVRLVFYPGEGHGNRRAGSRYDLSLRQLRWLEHYLKGPGGEPPPPELDYGLPLGE